MANFYDVLYKEYVILHRCYEATVEEIQSFIDDYSPWYVWALNVGIERIQHKKGNIDVWWYLGGTSFGWGEDKPFYSKIELQPVTTPDKSPSEIKITCQHPILLAHFFGDFSMELSRTFEEVDDYELKIPKTGEPTFASLAEYLIQKDLINREFLTLISTPETEFQPHEPYPVISSTNDELLSPRQSYSSSFTVMLPKTDEYLKRWKKAYVIIKQRRVEYNNEFLNRKAEKRIPTNKDFQDAIAFDMNWTVSERTLIKIKKTGDAGLLD